LSAPGVVALVSRPAISAGVQGQLHREVYIFLYGQHVSLIAERALPAVGYATGVNVLRCAVLGVQKISKKWKKIDSKIKTNVRVCNKRKVKTLQLSVCYNLAYF
jgi:hypothetical protein